MPERGCQYTLASVKHQGSWPKRPPQRAGPWLWLRIISGGQTGADRAALDWAIEHGIAHGGWCPKGRLAEDGTIPSRYGLRQTPSCDYEQRTAWNVRDADGTVIFSIGPDLSGGSLFTAAVAAELGKPFLHLAMTGETRGLLARSPSSIPVRHPLPDRAARLALPPSSQIPQPTLQAKGGLLQAARKAAVRLKAFVQKHGIRVLNVAGPRASTEPEVGQFVRETLDRAFSTGPCPASFQGRRSRNQSLRRV